MGERVFYVRAKDEYRPVTGYVPAKFPVVNGKPVVNPILGGSQDDYIYGDASDKYKVRAAVANPMNYIVVPANYSQQYADRLAAGIAPLPP